MRLGGGPGRGARPKEPTEEDVQRPWTPPSRRRWPLGGPRRPEDAPGEKHAGPAEEAGAAQARGAHGEGAEGRHRLPRHPLCWRSRALLTACRRPQQQPRPETLGSPTVDRAPDYLATCGPTGAHSTPHAGRELASATRGDPPHQEVDALEARIQAASRGGARRTYGGFDRRQRGGWSRRQPFVTRRQRAGTPSARRARRRAGRHKTARTSYQRELEDSGGSSRAKRRACDRLEQRCGELAASRTPSDRDSCPVCRHPQDGGARRTTTVTTLEGGPGVMAASARWCGRRPAAPPLPGRRRRRLGASQEGCLWLAAVAEGQPGGSPLVGRDHHIIHHHHRFPHRHLVYSSAFETDCCCVPVCWDRTQKLIFVVSQ